MNAVGITLVLIAIAAAGWWLRKLYAAKVAAEKMGELRDKSRDIAEHVRTLSDEELNEKLRPK